MTENVCLRLLSEVIYWSEAKHAHIYVHTQASDTFQAPILNYRACLVFPSTLCDLRFFTSQDVCVSCVTAFLPVLFFPCGLEI